VWDEEAPAEDDPLRQGDLLDGVVFPMLKQPVQVVRIEGSEGVLVPAKRKLGLVVSQCCDNEAGDYVAVAQVQTRGGLTAEQLEALYSYDPAPGAYEGYTIDAFLLEPFGDVLAPGKNVFVAELMRTAVFWGEDCAALRELRRARMTPTSRRHLRLNLSALWGRVEQEDEAALTAEGIPPGFRLTADG
jgi:hypothetical protein